MKMPSKFGLALAAVTVALVAGAGEANAKKKKHVSAAPRCVATVEGAATGTGILGLGTAKARISARANWEATATSVHGARYGNMNRARNVKWDCKKNALILAKCVVTARPCR